MKARRPTSRAARRARERATAYEWCRRYGHEWRRRGDGSIVLFGRMGEARQCVRCGFRASVLPSGYRHG